MSAIRICLALLFSLSLASAASLQLSPSEISITAFPGENLTRNISVTTSGNFSVSFNITITGNSTPADVLASMPSRLTIDGQANIPLTLSFASDMAPASINIKIAAQTEAPDEPASAPAESGGGGFASGPLGSTFVPSTTQITTGYTQQLRESDKIKFSLGEDSHSLTVDQITGDSATITIRSAPQTITLRPGQEAKLSVSSTLFYDILVKLESITNGKASVTMKSISEQIPVKEQPQEGPENRLATTAEREVTLTPSPPHEGFVKVLALATLIVLVVAIAMCWRAHRSRWEERSPSRKSLNQI